MEEANSADSQIADFRPPELRENGILPRKPLRLWATRPTDGSRQRTHLTPPFAEARSPDVLAPPTPALPHEVLSCAPPKTFPSSHLQDELASLFSKKQLEDQGLNCLWCGFYPQVTSPNPQHLRMEMGSLQI